MLIQIWVVSAITWWEGGPTVYYLFPFRVTCGLSLIQLSLGARWGNTLDRSPAYQKANMWRQLMHIYNLGLPINQMSLFLNCGRKLERTKAQREHANLKEKGNSPARESNKEHQASGHNIMPECIHGIWGVWEWPALNWATWKALRKKHNNSVL